MAVTAGAAAFPPEATTTTPMPMPLPSPGYLPPPPLSIGTSPVSTSTSITAPPTPQPVLVTEAQDSCATKFGVPTHSSQFQYATFPDRTEVPCPYFADGKLPEQGEGERSYTFPWNPLPSDTRLQQAPPLQWHHSQEMLYDLGSNGTVNAPLHSLDGMDSNSDMSSAATTGIFASMDGERGVNVTTDLHVVHLTTAHPDETHTGFMAAQHSTSPAMHSKGASMTGDLGFLACLEDDNLAFDHGSSID